MEKVKQEYMLNGLDCGNCAQKIEHEIAGMKGIEACSVNFATSTLTVKVDQNSGEDISSKIKKKSNRDRTARQREVEGRDKTGSIRR